VDQTRLSINVSKEAVELLTHWSAVDGVSITEIMRRALSVYKLCRETDAAGGEIIVETKAGVLKALAFD
jgi:hypothetical protein